MLLTTFRKFLRSRIAGRDQAVPALAHVSGVPPERISVILDDLATPTAPEAMRLLHALGLSVDEAFQALTHLSPARPSPGPTLTSEDVEAFDTLAREDLGAAIEVLRELLAQALDRESGQPPVDPRVAVALALDGRDVLKIDVRYPERRSTALMRRAASAGVIIEEDVHAYAGRLQISGKTPRAKRVRTHLDVIRHSPLTLLPVDSILEVEVFIPDPGVLWSMVWRAMPAPEPATRLFILLTRWIEDKSGAWLEPLRQGLGEAQRLSLVGDE